MSVYVAGSASYCSYLQQLGRNDLLKTVRLLTSRLDKMTRKYAATAAATCKCLNYSHRRQSWELIKRLATSLCASVCDSVYLCVCPHVNSQTTDPKVFKLGIGNDIDIAYKSYDFGVKKSKVKVTGSQGAKRRSSGRRELCTR